MLLDLNCVCKKGTHLSFQAGDNHDYLGPQIESYNSSQIAALETDVPNPFYWTITSESSPLSTATIPDWQIQMRVVTNQVNLPRHLQIALKMYW